ncbi:MAG TPA: TMEM175 family protein [Anaerolineae bacterium]|nr:TMEM175 family protein [Anaerolineae bacterium]
MKAREREPHIERMFELERIIFFSDAVFAIAITLLALELHVPDIQVTSFAPVWNAILNNWPHFFAFALSFWIIATYWLAHHRCFRYIVRFDGGLIWRNFLVLFFIILLPFTTLVLGEYGNLPDGVVFYGLNMLALGLSLAWLWYLVGPWLGSCSPSSEGIIR